MKSTYKMALAALGGAALGAAAIHVLHAQGKPLAYAITEVEIIDHAAFNEFSPKVPATMQPFGGKYLVRGGKVVALDGDASKRVVVSVFDSIEKAQAWARFSGMEGSHADPDQGGEDARISCRRCNELKSTA
jgi:uncharacterized protein (DUF1330 family)